MKFFAGKRKKTYTVIIGCGRLGAALANMLSAEGQSVLIMDEDKKSFRRLTPDYGGMTLEGSGTDLDSLRKAEMQRASAVIAAAGDDKRNIMIAQLARELFRVERVMAGLCESEFREVYEEFGIETVCPWSLAAAEFAKALGGEVRS